MQRFADPKAAAAADRSAASPGVNAYPEEKRVYPQRTVGAQVVGFAGHRQQGARRARGPVRPRPLRQARQADDRPRPVRPRDRRHQRDRRAAGPRRLHDDRPHDPGECRGGAARRRSRSGTRSRRRRSCSTRAPAPCSRWRRRRATTRTRRARCRSRLQRNRAVTDTYEPGSTFKLVTIAGALSNGPRHAGRRSSRCRTRSTVADRIDPRRRAARHRDALASRRSSRTRRTSARSRSQSGSARTALADWIDEFGFGKTTGVDFPGESPGQVLPPDEWSGSTIGNVPIGQGIAVTPIQMAAAYAAIANGGVWVAAAPRRPHRRPHAARFQARAHRRARSRRRS